MKLKKTILGMAVVAVAGVNAFNANNVNAQRTDTTLNDVEQLAEAEVPGSCANAPCMYDPYARCCHNTYDGTCACSGDILC